MHVLCFSNGLVFVIYTIELIIIIIIMISFMIMDLFQLWFYILK